MISISGGIMQLISIMPLGIVCHRKLDIASDLSRSHIEKTRGNIEGLSQDSRTRLRKKIMTTACPWPVYSVTLTIPGEVMPWEQEKKIFDAYYQSFRNKKVCFIWRKEIQARGASHWHCIFWAHSNLSYHDILYPWHAALGDRLKLKGARLYSVHIEKLEGEDKDCSLWCRYMQDHMTKSKKVQEAHEGRQWGVINKKYFEEAKPSKSFVLSIEEWSIYRRVQRNIFRKFKKNKSSPFGYSQGFKSYRGVHGRSDWFTETSIKESLKTELETIISKRNL